MTISTVLLEDWLRKYYFETEIDISCSGVRNFSFAELRRIGKLRHKDLDEIVFNDGYSLGSDGLRAAVSRRWSNGDTDRVLMTHGSSEAIHLLLHALLEPGDEVVALDPVYPQYLGLAESIGCRIKRWRLRFESRFVPDFEEGRSLITPRTRLLIVNFPHNPTGVSVDAAQQRELLELAAGVGAYVIWDSAFAELVYDTAPLTDPSMLYERCISIGTLSKGYGLAGLRVGWCIGDPCVLERCVRFRDYVTLHLSPLVERIAIHAVANADSLLRPRLAEARINLQILAGWVRHHELAVQWVHPQGGVCTLLRFPDVPEVTSFCETLARQYGVLVVPGACFDQPSCVRVGFGGATSQLNEGLRRLATALDAVHDGQRTAATH